jgi:transglutaminase-like putative cysteine protease
MKRIRIRHDTTYDYSAPVTLQTHRLLLRPRAGHDIRIERASLVISPKHEIKWSRDIYDNSVVTATFLEPTQRLSVASDVTILHWEDSPFNFLVDERALQFPFYSDLAERVEMIPYQMLCFPNDSAVIRQWAQPFWRPGQMIETYALLDAINKAIARDFEYRVREEPGVQRPSETLQKRSGSCRDFATLFIETCRYFGLAARFVSGYLHWPATATGHGYTHAWSEVYLPGAGWIGFDSTSGLVAGADHIAAAVTRHPAEAPPISGTFVSAPLATPPTMTVKVDVSEVL